MKRTNVLFAIQTLIFTLALSHSAILEAGNWNAPAVACNVDPSQALAVLKGQFG